MVHQLPDQCVQSLFFDGPPKGGTVIHYQTDTINRHVIDLPLSIAQIHCPPAVKQPLTRISGLSSYASLTFHYLSDYIRFRHRSLSPAAKQKLPDYLLQRSMHHSTCCCTAQTIRVQPAIQHVYDKPIQIPGACTKVPRSQFIKYFSNNIACLRNPPIRLPIPFSRRVISLVA